RAVQELRKQARLRYADAVRLAVVGDSAELAAVLGEHGDWLAGQCRVTAVTRVPLADPIGTTTVDLAGTRVELALGR
ncbi:MAG TPA: hypothetical protein VLX92_07500, partial [Kofleriaceae bacterium]|nr:hypothetical protein [Kofleriaceae bacterium]